MKFKRLIGIRMCKARLNIILRLYSVRMKCCLIRALNDSFDIIPNLSSEAVNRSPPSFIHIINSTSIYKPLSFTCSFFQLLYNEIK